MLGRNLNGADGAREAGGKGDHSLAVYGGVDVLEHGVAGKHAPKGLADAPRAGFHLHIGAHPAHRALFSDHRFAVLQVADDDGHGFSDNLILHLLFLLKVESTEEVLSPGSIFFYYRMKTAPAQSFCCRLLKEPRPALHEEQKARLPV